MERHWGHSGRGAHAFRSLLQRGVPLVFGSDVPVASLDPRAGIHAALERKGVNGAPATGWMSEERIGFLEAVAGYTVGAAHAVGVGIGAVCSPPGSTPTSWHGQWIPRRSGTTGKPFARVTQSSPSLAARR